MMVLDSRLTIILLVAVSIFIVFQFSVKSLRRLLIKKAKSKKQISNIKILTRMVSVILFLFVILLAFFAYFRSWTGIGIFAGLITAGLSFALQRPISSVAAWLLIVIQRPFIVGDRIIIGNVRGDVYDITLTHIYLDEVGENIAKGEVTGRNIMVPNYMFFEQNIINYTLTHEFVLASLDVSITYESNLKKAIKLVESIANEVIEKYSEKYKEAPYTRIGMADSSMNITLRFFVPARKMGEVKSLIITEIYERIKKEKDIEFAYPHTELVFKDKNFTKKN
jgi:small-conductance mechanosensitive channel